MNHSPPGNGLTQDICPEPRAVHDLQQTQIIQVREAFHPWQNSRPWEG